MTKNLNNQAVAQSTSTQANGVRANGTASPKSLSRRPHRSAMPAPGRKVNFEEAMAHTFEVHGELLQRLAK